MPRREVDHQNTPDFSSDPREIAATQGVSAGGLYFSVRSPNQQSDRSVSKKRQPWWRCGPWGWGRAVMAWEGGRGELGGMGGGAG